MKSPLKLLLLSAAIAAGTLALVWGGGILYWHVRITSALRSWERNYKTSSDNGALRGLIYEDALILGEARCRALPHLVKAMEESSDPGFQACVMSQIISCLAGPGPANEHTFEVMNERGIDWQFISPGLDFERKEKMAKFREWWHKNGHRYHQTWRFWSSWCYEE